METQPDTLFEDQVLVITYRTRDRSGPLQCKLANCLCISSKEVKEEIKSLSPAELDFISVSYRLEMSFWLKQLALQPCSSPSSQPGATGVLLLCPGWMQKPQQWGNTHWRGWVGQKRASSWS